MSGVGGRKLELGVGMVVVSAWVPQYGAHNLIVISAHWRLAAGPRVAIGKWGR